MIFMLVALFIIGDAKGYLSPVKSGFFSVYGAGASVIFNSVVGVKNFFSTFLFIKSLSHENDILNQKVDELAFENARLKAAKQENIALRKALNFAEESELTLIPVSIKIADPSGLSQTVVIDRGDDYELKENMALVASPGLLVGKITKVYSGSSVVTLITDPSVNINAEVAESEAKGLIVGAHGLSLKFDLITQNEVIKTGDQVITSGLAGDYPRGLLIGEISSISSSASDLFQKAYVTPSANLRNLKFLFAVKAWK